MNDATEDRLPLSQRDSAERVRRIRLDIKASDDRHKKWRRDAADEFDINAGKQWSAEDEAILREQNRPPVTFNRIGVLIDAVVGSQINNRQETAFLPRDMSADQGLADVLKGIVDWARDSADAEDAETEAFRDMAVCGMGWINNRPDYEEDPSGRLVKERLSPLKMRWDPASGRKNLVDARWKAYVDEKPADDVKAIWPHFSGSIALGRAQDGVLSGSVQPARDQYATGEDDDGAADIGTVEVIEYHWCEPQAVFAVADPQSGGVVHMPAERWEQIAASLPDDQRPRAVRLAQKRWFRSIICGEQELQGPEPCPDPEDSTFQCMTAKRDENRNVWYGLVRPLAEPQRWANKWLSQSLHILNTSAKSGLIYEDQAIDDVRQFEMDYARPGGMSKVAAGALSGGRIKEKQTPTMPPGFYQLLQFAIGSIPDLSGVNREMLGLADREQAGILEAQRKQASQAVLSPLFDALRLYYKRDGRQMARLVSLYVPQDKQIRILGQDGNPQIIQAANMPDARMFDIVVDEAPTSPNAKAEVWQFMAPALPQLMRAGIPPQAWGELLKFSPMPEAAVEKIVQAISPPPGPPPPDPEMVKAQNQLQIEQQRAQADMQMKAMQVQADAELAREKARIEAEVARYKAEQEMALEIWRAQQMLDIKRMEAQASAALDAERMRRQEARADAAPVN